MFSARLEDGPLQVPKQESHISNYEKHRQRKKTMQKNLNRQKLISEQYSTSIQYTHFKTQDRNTYNPTPATLP